MRHLNIDLRQHPSSSSCFAGAALRAILLIWMANTALGGDMTARVSVASGNVQADGASSWPSLSADGRYVAFESDSTNLAPGAFGHVRYVYVHDRLTGETAVALPSRPHLDGSNLGGCFSSPSIAADGSRVAFASSASMTPEDTNGGNWDIYVYDRQTDLVTLASTSLRGDTDDADSDSPSLSGQGRHVAFESTAAHLVPFDTNAARDVFVRDLQTGHMKRVSVASSGAQGDLDSYRPSISADGRYVAFTSNATTLVAGDTNQVADVFVHDLQTGQTVRVSVDSSGGQADHRSDFASISADGRYVAFTSSATTLVAGDTNHVDDVFVHDLQTGQTVRVSVDSSGGQADDDCFTYSQSIISADGRHVTFSSYADNLVPGDSNHDADVFLHDRLTGSTKRLSVSSSGLEGDGSSGDSVAISPDGRYVAFDSFSDNLVQGDTNLSADVFLRGPWFTLEADPAVASAGQTLTLTTYKGIPGVAATLWVVQVNGAPIFQLLVQGRFGPDGLFVVSGAVPPGLAGADITFRGYDNGPMDGVLPTNDATVSFR